MVPVQREFQTATGEVVPATRLSALAATVQRKSTTWFETMVTPVPQEEADSWSGSW